MNCRMTVLQTVALPLGYITICDCLEWKGRKRLLPPFRRAELHVGAGDEARTRYLHLGKVALYRMSYTRKWCLRPELNWRHADFQSAALPTELPRRIKEPSQKAWLMRGDPEQTRTVDLQRDRLAC